MINANIIKIRPSFWLGLILKLKIHLAINSCQLSCHMKKIFIMFLLLSFVTPTYAQNNGTIQKEIESHENAILELERQLESDDTVDSEVYTANGLEMIFTINKNTTHNADGWEIESEEGVLLIIKINYKASGDDPAVINSDDFRLSLADIGYPKTWYMNYSLDREAVPPGVDLENYIIFDLPTHIADAKDLVLEYEPRDNMFIAEDVLFSIAINQ